MDKDPGYCYCFSDAYLLNPSYPVFVHKSDCTYSKSKNEILKRNLMINFTHCFVYHKASNEIYYVKLEQSYSSYIPKCFCITFLNFIIGNKVNTVEYDGIFDKNRLLLLELSGSRLREIDSYRSLISGLVNDIRTAAKEGIKELI